MEVVSDDCLIEFLSNLKILFEKSEKVTTLQIAELFYNGNHEYVVRLTKALQARDMIIGDLKEKVLWLLTKEGDEYTNVGTPEYRVFTFVKNKEKQKRGIETGGEESKEVISDGLDLSSLKTFLPDIADVGLKNAMRNKWIFIDSKTKLIKTVTDNVEDISCLKLSVIKKVSSNQEKNNQEFLFEKLKEISCNENPETTLQDFKRRNLVKMRKIKYLELSVGKDFNTPIKKKAIDLTQDMIISGSWKDTELKPYNFFAQGRCVYHGSIHPLIKTLNKFKRILLCMGFEEMNTKQFVDSSFWNFDVLYMPQQHPSRDAQDTFFIKNPEYARIDLMPYDYVKKVKAVHEVGGYGSTGWKYSWSEKEALKCVLRTHTTGTSAKLLYLLGKTYKETGKFTPKKYFSIDRVFRNETLDATHLAEFHQVEGVVAGRGYGIGHLKGILRAFYKKIGIDKLRFKPTANPYTEPSMEIFGFHPTLQKWIEVGNSGIFRPELILPTGLPDDVTVLGWGLSVERPTMIRYGIENIRELFGYKATLGTANH